METVKIVNFFGLNLWQVGLNMNYHIYMLELERLLEDQSVKKRVYWKLMLQLIQVSVTMKRRLSGGDFSRHIPRPRLPPRPPRPRP